MGVLDGRVVMVTGGGNGIGRECALIAAAEGAKVMVNDLGGSLKGDDEGSAGPAEAVAEEIRKNGGKAISNSQSVTNLAAVEEMRDQCLKEFGALHSVINPAGILRDGMFHKMAEQDWDSVIAVHLKGSFNVCRATIEHFREQGEGSYVLFTSTSGLIGNVGQTNYGAAKMGIAGLAHIIAMEGASKGVRANAIAPGAQTRMTDSVPIKTAEQAARRANVSIERSARWPAVTAVALASPLATKINGQFVGSSGYNVSLYSQPRPVSNLKKEGGWTPKQLIDEAFNEWEPLYTTLARMMPPPVAPAPAKA